MTIPPAIRQMAQTVKYQEVSMSHQEKKSTHVGCETRPCGMKNKIPKSYMRIRH